MAPKIPARSGTSGKPTGNPSLLDLFNGNFFEMLFRLLTGDAGWLTSTGGHGPLSRIVESASLLFMRWTQVDGLQETVDDHTEAIARLDDIAAAFQVTPAYVSDAQDMASCPRSGLVKWIDNAPVHPTFLPQTYAFSSTGRVYFAPIPVDRRGKPKKVRWMVGADSSIFSIDDYRIALMVYNPTNGNLENVWTSANIKDAEANVSGGVREVEIDMGLDQICTPGQLLFVAHMQKAPGLAQAPRSFSVMPQTNVGRPSSMLLDASSYKTSGGLSAIPSSIALSSLVRDNLGIPWAAVSVDPIPPEEP